MSLVRVYPFLDGEIYTLQKQVLINTTPYLKSDVTYLEDRCFSYHPLTEDDTYYKVIIEKFPEIML